VEEVALSLVSAAIGFFFSQFFNFVEFIRRPRFKVVNHSDGVLSSYTGGDSDTPWEIELGFYLDNKGWNPAKNLRVFISELCVWNAETSKFDETLLGFSELQRPIDLLPSKQSLRVIIGKITGDDCSLRINFEGDIQADEIEFLASDTRFKTKFRAKLFFFCDDQNSSSSVTLEFDPSSDEDWTANFFEQYDSLEFRRSIVMPHLSNELLT
jgi:hypothetical protein